MTTHSPASVRLRLLVLGTTLAMVACTSATTTPAPPSPTILHDDPMSPLPRPSSPGPTTIAIPSDQPPTSTPTRVASPTPQPTPYVSMDTTDGPSWTIPPGETRSARIGFEGTPQAQLTLMTDKGASPIKATLGGKAIPQQSTTNPTATFYNLVLDHPVDAILRVTNTGKKAVAVGTIVWVLTTRHLAVKPSTTFVAKGESATVDVFLSDPVAGDVVTLEDIGAAGHESPIALTAQGGGHWSGIFVSTVSGQHRLFAQSVGPARRLGSVEIAVLSGDVTLGSGFTERLEDANGDGLADALVLSPTVTVKVAGSFQVNADLTDADGRLVARTGGQQELAAGTQPLDLSFEGTQIHGSGASGPYQLRNVYIFDPASTAWFEAVRLDFGPTSPFDYQDFQH